MGKFLLALVIPLLLTGCFGLHQDTGNPEVDTQVNFLKDITAACDTYFVTLKELARANRMHLLKPKYVRAVDTSNSIVVPMCLNPVDPNKYQDVLNRIREGNKSLSHVLEVSK